MTIIERLKLSGRILIKGTLSANVGNPKRREVPTITAAEVAEAKSFFPLEKFFIFGHARSGTTLLTRLIRLHPQIHCNYQAHFFTRAPLLEALVSDEEVGVWLSRRSNRWNQGRDLSPLVLRTASDFIMERDARRVGKGGPGCLVGDKSPNSLLNGEAVRLLVKVYPEARLIFIVRDGRDAVSSHRFQAFVDNPQGLAPEDRRIREDFARNSEPFLNGQRSIFTEKILRQEARGWVRNVVETDQVARELLGERYIHLRYEDLLQQPHEEMSRLWEFLGADPKTSGLHEALDAELQQNPDADWQQQKAGEIAGALQKGKRGTWREIFTPRDREIFDIVAGETLAAWGYSNK
jgi:hypothetical protein